MRIQENVRLVGNFNRIRELSEAGVGATPFLASLRIMASISPLMMSKLSSSATKR